MDQFFGAIVNVIHTRLPLACTLINAVTSVSRVLRNGPPGPKRGSEEECSKPP